MSGFTGMFETRNFTAASSVHEWIGCALRTQPIGCRLLVSLTVSLTCCVPRCCCLSYFLRALDGREGAATARSPQGILSDPPMALYCGLPQRVVFRNPVANLCVSV